MKTRRNGRSVGKLFGVSVILAGITAANMGVAQTPLVLINGTLAESGTSHTSGTIANESIYTADGVRFSSSLIVSNTSVAWITTGTFVRITGTNHSVITINGGTGSGAIMIAHNSQFNTTNYISSSSISIDGSSLFNAVDTRVVNFTYLYNSSTLLANSSTFATITGSNNITIKFLDSTVASGIITLRDSALLDVERTEIYSNSVNFYNSSTVSGTFRIKDSMIDKIFTGSNLGYSEIKGSEFRGTVTIGNDPAISGTLLVESSTFGASLSGRGMAGATLNNVVGTSFTFRETDFLEISDMIATGNLSLYNAGTTGTMLINTSTIAGTVTGSNVLYVGVMSSTIAGRFVASNLLAAGFGTVLVESSTTSSVSGTNMSSFLIRNAKTLSVTLNNELTGSGTLLIESSTVGTVTGSNVAVASIGDASTGTITLRENSLFDMKDSVANGGLYIYNVTETGTILVNTSAVTGAMTGSNVLYAKIEGSQVDGTFTLNNQPANSGTLIVESSVLANITASNVVEAFITSATTGIITLREVSLLDVGAGSVTGAIIARNDTASSGTLLINSSTTAAISATNIIRVQIENAVSTAINMSTETDAPGSLFIKNSAVTSVTGSGLDAVSIDTATTTNISLRETGLLEMEDAAATGYVYFYNIGTTGTMLLATSTITGTVTGTNVLYARVEDSRIGGPLTLNIQPAGSGTLLINSSTTASITGSNVAFASIGEATTGNITLRENSLFDLGDSVVNGYAYVYNAGATGTMLINTSTITGAMTGGNVLYARIEDSHIGGPLTLNHEAGNSGTLVVASSTLANITGSNVAFASITNATTGNIVLRENGLFDLGNSVVSGFAYVYNEADTGTMLISTSTISGAVTGSNVVYAKVMSSTIGGALVASNLASGTSVVLIESSTTASVSATNVSSLGINNARTEWR